MIFVDELQLPWKEGLTIAQLLEDMAGGYDYAVVRLNDRVVTRPHFKTTSIPDEARIQLIPMVAGG
jgi:sulfur carrier protein